MHWKSIVLFALCLVCMPYVAFGEEPIVYRTSLLVCEDPDVMRRAARMTISEHVENEHVPTVIEEFVRQKVCSYIHAPDCIGARNGVLVGDPFAVKGVLLIVREITIMARGEIVDDHGATRCAARTHSPEVRYVVEWAQSRSKQRGVPT